MTVPEKLQGRLVTVFGGSGFVGRHVVRALAKDGWRIRVAVRRPDLANFLQPLGDVGQIQAVQANLRYPGSIAPALAGSDAVINLVGILYETRRQTFDAVHGFGARAIAAAARAEGVRRMIQMSAIGAASDAPAHYARSKAMGEQFVAEEFPDAVIFRPSVVFGPEDDFFNRFAGLARLSPALPLIGGGETRFQPVFVGDIARAAVSVLAGRGADGSVYELGGPEVRTFRQLMEFVLEATRRKRILVPVPFVFARLQARFLQLLPKPLLTVDQVRLLETDNVVSQQARSAHRTLAGLGVTARSFEAIAPTYLERFRATGKYARNTRFMRP